MKDVRKKIADAIQKASNSIRGTEVITLGFSDHVKVVACGCVLTIATNATGSMINMAYTDDSRLLVDRDDGRVRLTIIDKP